MTEDSTSPALLPPKFTHRRLIALLVLFLVCGVGAGLPAGAESVAPVPAPPPSQNAATLPHYSLPPAQLQQARNLYHWRTALDFAVPVWGILVLVLILELGWPAGLRRFASAVGGRRWVQWLVFFPLLLLLIALLDLPPAVVEHHVGLVYRQSIEQWPAWFGDWGKGLVINLITGTIALAVVFLLIRASARRWWFWIWLVSLPTSVLVVFILPVFINPLFFHFSPLQASHPRLVTQLERVIARTDVEIPPSRIFLMRASTKVTGANAYVTGFGSSKRVVIWDTTIQTCPENEILVIFGHELGHYVLHHIQRGLAYGAVISFFFIWAGFYIVHFFLRRCSVRWKIGPVEDPAAAAVLLLVLAILSFFAQPVINGISRVQEHEADVFGQEVVHGIVPHPGLVMAQAFQKLGEQSLAYPDPNRFVVFWTYTHPPIAARESFAVHYDPWQPGHHPRYFKKQRVGESASQGGNPPACMTNPPGCPRCVG